MYAEFVSLSNNSVSVPLIFLKTINISINMFSRPDFITESI